MNNQTAIIISGLVIALAIYMGLSSQKTEYEACVEYSQELKSNGQNSVTDHYISISCAGNG